jgi:hypothetical protein
MLCSIVVHVLLGLVAGNVISPNCEAFPGQRVLLTSVSDEDVDFFENWLHHAGQYLSATDHLTVIADDEKATERLADLLSVQPTLPQFEVIAGFKVNVTKIPDKILMYVAGGCSTLYFKSDSAWKFEGPLLSLEASGVHDVVLTWEVPPRSASPAFMYVQPTMAAKLFMTNWAEVWDAPGMWETKQQEPGPVPDHLKPVVSMNKALWTPSRSGLDHEFLAVQDFPIAHWAERAHHLTCINSYTYYDNAKKVQLFKNMSSWAVADHTVAEKEHTVVHKEHPVVHKKDSKHRLRRKHKKE